MREGPFVPLILYCASLLLSDRCVDADVAVVTSNDCLEPIRNWCRLTWKWAGNRPQARTQFAVATYQRYQNASAPALTRILIYGGLAGNTQMIDSWIYSHGTNSWTPATLPITYNNWDIEHGGNWQSSLTTICHTKIILLRHPKKPSLYRQLINRQLDEITKTQYHTWLFDGAREEWQIVYTASPVPNLLDYSVSAVSREESLCHCKESLLVYGGLNFSSSTWTNDLWELRCVDDSDFLIYRWRRIQKKSPTSLWPPMRANPISFSIEAEVYILGSYIPKSPLRRKRNVMDGVWKFDLQTSTWTLHDTPHFDSSINLVRSVAVFVKQAGVLMLLDKKMVTVYDVAKRSIASSNIGGWYDKCDIVVEKSSAIGVTGIATEEIVLLLGSIRHSDSLEAWKINKTLLENENTTIDASRESTLNISVDGIDQPELYPSTLTLLRYGFDYYAATALFAGDFVFVMNTEDSQFWRLDLEKKMWTKYDHDREPDFTDAAVAAFGNNHLVAFAKEKRLKTLKYELWIYTASLRLWTNTLQQSGHRPLNERYWTLTLMQNKSLVLFGSEGNLADLYILTINLSTMTAAWHRPITAPKPSTDMLAYLSLMYFYSAQGIHSSVVNDTLYVYGGFFYEKMCNVSMIQIHLDTTEASFQSFKQLHSSKGANDCFVQSAVIGNYFFYATTKIFIDVSLDGNLKILDLWSGHQDVVNWNGYTASNFLYLEADHEKLVAWVSSLAEEPAWSLYMLTPGCAPGMYSEDFERYPCRPCPQGMFSDKPGAIKCVKCPGDMTTPLGSISIENCTCDENACYHGKCSIQSDYTTVCVCNSGYTGKSCQYPTQFLIGFGSVIGTLVLVAFLYCANRIRKHRKAASSRGEQLQETQIVLKKAKQTLMELSNIWSVDTEEIAFKNVIGRGSFGDVWSAEYRDQIVAVKVLKIKAVDCTDEQLKDFNDESELLRSVFHANIVRFIGTGKNAEGKPFIVLEYMERGSARHELDTNYAHTPMELKLQVKWALDAAKGMRHLHAIERMHRDLKCDNLLINNHGVVKVADLGCTKLVPKIIEGHNITKGTKAVGTALFRAPEIIRGQDYDSSVDVYSYGITLWEIQTAKHPYDKQFQPGVTARDILKRVVEEELRPEFPTYCDKDMIELTQSCWHTSPFQRPTFDDIVLKLEAICFRDQIGKNITYVKL